MVFMSVQCQGTENNLSMYLTSLYVVTYSKGWLFSKMVGSA